MTSLFQFTPDPKLDLAIKDFPVTGPDAGRLNRDNFTMQVIGIKHQKSFIISLIFKY